ncbi:hypothetical protein SAMN04489740_4145 [Arthrobacter alpinus]|uniref:Uncharacterized protein n=1 Tax=Arthrobacter alpinus TaxID=656366 RepID=A0A1H5PFB5_9MICC|nr:hypothetical protein [Arthrobacter alpinus]SEF11808.1 hypothetical protein SAMN04489740_4145 [Arthrobacter alpinus]
MAGILTEAQENLAAYAWTLAQHREALANQLADVEQYEREAIRAAEPYGVKQKTLAALTGRSPGRVSQIIKDQSSTQSTTLAETREKWRQALDEPQDHLAKHEKGFSTAVTISTWNTNFMIVHGEDSGVF